MSSAAEIQPIRVFMLPDFRGANPYQTLLTNAVANYNVQVEFPNGYRRVLPIFRAIKALPKTPDLVHIHWLGPYIRGEKKVTKIAYALKFLTDVIATKRNNIHFIWTIHNRVSHDATFPALELWVQRRLVQIVDGIILHNQATAIDLSQEFGFGLSKAKAIPIGHYRGIYHPLIDSSQARQLLRLPQRGRIYFHLGLLRRYKGIDTLIKIWKANQNLFANDTLLIAGKAEDPVYAQELEVLAAETDGVKVVAKYIADQDLHHYYSAADVMVFPFTTVLNSSSVIAAMSYDKPIIAPRLGGIPETVGEASELLYDANDNQGLLNALRHSCQIDLQKLAQLTSTACDKLDWQTSGKSTAEFYWQVLKI